MNRQEIDFELPSKIDHYLATLSKYYEKEGQEKLQEIIVNSHPVVGAGWSYDNWDGTHGHALYLRLPESIYLNIVDEKSELKSRIREELNKVHDIQNEFIAEVFFEMEVPDDHDWRKDSGLLISHHKSISAPITDRIWNKDCFRLFLSHKTEVKQETAELKDKLRLYGISCFVAHEDIHPTQDWQNEIENALHTMDAFVALLTDGFHDSFWTDQEVGFAFGRGVPILSVKLGKNPYGFIGKFQALSSNWNDAPFEIVKILIKNETMINAYINATQTCTGYDDSNNLAELLPFIQDLSDDQIKKLVTSYNGNSQLYDSYGFNGNKPAHYGDGLLHQLQQLTNANFTFSSCEKKIVIT